jgi:hypothetical protein
MGVESDEEFRDFMRGRWSAMVRLAYTLTGDPDAYVRAIVRHRGPGSSAMD